MGQRFFRLIGVLTFILGYLLGAVPVAAQTSSLGIVSLTSGGAVVSADSTFPVCSSDARVIAFASRGGDIAGSDSNGVTDVFVRNTGAGTTDLVSVSLSGVAGDAASGDTGLGRPISISRDGRIIAFNSLATDLVAGDSNQIQDVFVRDLTTGVTSIISIAELGTASNNLSFDPAVSSDGNFVAFTSAASTLVPGDTNSSFDVFLKNRAVGTLTRVSVNSAGNEAIGNSYSPVVSDDGRYVAFLSDIGFDATDQDGQADVYVKDTATGITEWVSPSGASSEITQVALSVAMSGDGRYVAFTSFTGNHVANDTNGFPDAFVRDRSAGTTALVSSNSGGVQSQFGSGSYVSISQDGQYVAFSAAGDDLVTNDTSGTTDVFVKDILSGRTFRASETPTGGQTGGASDFASVCGSPLSLVFRAPAAGLVSGGSDTVGNILLSTISFAPPTLRRDTKLTLPPTVTVEGRSATVLLEQFLAPKVTKKTRMALLERAGTLAARRPGGGGKTSILYNVIVKPVGGKRKDIERRSSKRNVVTFKNLPTGTLTAQYTVEVRQGERTVFRTNMSPAGTFVVP